MAIQTLLAENGGIILIDEIEQGLEPDRVQHIVSTLKKNDNIQTFITTHSSNVIVELDASDLYLLSKENGFLRNVSRSLQGNIRRNPEALFAKRIVVCEGATEVGICRAVNDFLIGENRINAAHKGIRFVDGNGANFINDCLAFKKLNFDVVAFCDSDDKIINQKKGRLTEKGIEIIDCDKGNSIENQIFQDLPWGGIIKLVKYQEEKPSSQSVKDQVEHYLGTHLLNNWMQQDSKELRKAIGISSISGEWFKRIDHGQFLGLVVCQNLRLMEGKKLKYQIEKFISWINR
ncbi:AAA domain-containing protein, putative AbiEii toxin, Type IV TA system [Tangfeifania diversioriginum]|uniref:AAA domain-containing protein, putative AbiEii toxin, Type IV TA system n=2 Tax=Tangfeifania diversioriginum TaxID=1168035 RepID=A0A1M6NWX4_9BACT|nr:AAA domain-containing protein, putative AbiEii toxin, Type IV TA system [Tangfeifania diversioriginum]